MPVPTRTAFYAYPSDPKFICDSITDAVQITNDGGKLQITPWQSLNIIGFKLDNLIRSRIAEADLFIADITYPNFNVYYEIGYCIGSEKPFLPTVNSAVERATENVNLLGLFDTVGQLRYQNAAELAGSIGSSNFTPLTNQYMREKNHTQPLFLLDTAAKIDFRNYIVQTISNSSLEMRTFDPDEVSRLSLPGIIADISSSAGVVVPLLSTEIRDSHKHNLRAAFIAGLAHGFNIEALIIQYEDRPAPLDYRDFINTVRSRREVDQAVSEYAQATLIRNQEPSRPLRMGQRTLLQRLDIGASAAENEAQRLGLYFVETAEFARAVRADAGIVVGRKGSGKSAIFHQVLALRVEDKRNLIIDLKPASHNLTELRENLVAAKSAGLFEHTIAAFWQYIIYTEILLKVREALLPKAKYNLALLQKIEQLEKDYGITQELASGDFTSRLEIAVQNVVRELERTPTGKDARQYITNVLFEKTISNVRRTIASLASDYDRILLLFDDLDKGWPPRKVEEHDVLTVRHLIDALNKIHRELEKEGVNFQYLLFLRSDVYERLVAETSDRGKYNPISVDWSDAEQLEYLIRQRVLSSFTEGEADAAWQAINPRLPSGETAIRTMIQNSLMRPRFLIDLCEKAVSFAINRGHNTVQAIDVEDALQQHSLYLVSDFGYEVRDVSGLSETVFYDFLGKGDTFTTEELHEILNSLENSLPNTEVIDLLIWYGFLGVPDKDGRPIFIYDRNYDMRRFEVERKGNGDDLLYVVNPAFLRGL